jgi:hypothetical protein
VQREASQLVEGAKSSLQAWSDVTRSMGQAAERIAVFGT